MEQLANVALALQQALVQVDDGVLEIARAWPKGWNAAGTVFIAGSSTVGVQIRDGVVVAVGLDSRSDHDQAMRNPWPGQRIRVLAMPDRERTRPAAGSPQLGGTATQSGRGQGARAVVVTVELARGGHTLQRHVAATSNDQFVLSLRRGVAYRVQCVDAAAANLPLLPYRGNRQARSKGWVRFPLDCRQPLSPVQDHSAPPAPDGSCRLFVRLRGSARTTGLR